MPIATNTTETEWNIDKALGNIIDCTTPGIVITQVLVDKLLWNRYNLSPTFPEHVTNPESCFAWCIGVGKMTMPKVYAYGMTIREAYENVKKTIDELSTEERSAFGIRQK